MAKIPLIQVDKEHLRCFLKFQRAYKYGDARRLVFFIVDDSSCKKEQLTKKMEALSFQYSHEAGKSVWCHCVVTARIVSEGSSCAWVLLTPCIDYVIVFTHLGRGNEKLVLVSTPILFVIQMLLLPIYLWLFMGNKASEIVSVGPFLEAFLGLIVVPLVLALLTQWWSR